MIQSNFDYIFFLLAVHALWVRAETGSLPMEGLEIDGFHRLSTGFTEALGDFSEARGQFRYKRTLEIAAAGGHNLLVFGPPGTGKTMLARRIPTIMPPLEDDEAVEVTRLHSLAGQLLSFPGGLIQKPPFRAPHHSASTEGILGGGRIIRPGEISLAHRGVLFLDEALEFRTPVLQSLREPLEDRVITISRAEGPVRLPADFQLILACNNCPCGRFGLRNQGSPCFCSTEEIRRYWKKIGAALMDRIELRTMAQAPEFDSFNRKDERSAEIALRVLKAVEIQRKRFQNKEIKQIAPNTRRNAGMSPSLIERFCPMTGRAKEALSIAFQKLNLSGRAYHGILRVARTIADLDEKDEIDSLHILEAVEHRRLGDDPWDMLS